MSLGGGYHERLINARSRAPLSFVKAEFVRKARVLADRGDKGGEILLICDDSQFVQEVVSDISSECIPYEQIAFEKVIEERVVEVERFNGAMLLSLDMRLCHEAALVLKDTCVDSLPVDFYFHPIQCYSTLLDHDIFDDVFFVSPLLISGIDVFGIYENSLNVFEKKCQIRDYLDLALSLYDLHRRKVEGAIVEFGSYRGHSGFLISQLLEAMGSDKVLYMFDTFEGFPEESEGVDWIWNGTHDVIFEEVRGRFEGRTNVEFVRGDFTETFDSSGVEKIALAFVDCDSYRGTRYLSHRLFEDVIESGGLMIFEDYGHPPLLGNRMAFHEFFDTRTDCFTFFSQFSGIQIVAKR